MLRPSSVDIEWDTGDFISQLTREVALKFIEHVSSAGELLVIIIRKNYRPDETVFITSPELKQQVGFVVYPVGGEIERHSHRPIKREIEGTSEVLVVLQGRCLIDIYDNSDSLVKTCELEQDDIMIMVGGGHGFRMLEDTVFLEVKQGPFVMEDEKRLF